MTLDARILHILTKILSSGWTWVGLIALTLVGIFAWEATHQEAMVQHLNPAIWVVTNLILFLGYAALLFYVLVYGLVFDWVTLPNGHANIGGRIIFSLTTALAGLVGLALIRSFLVPSTGLPWYVAPDDPTYWFPTLRFLVYTAVVGAFIAMDVTIVRRIVRSQPLDITVPTRQTSNEG